MENHLLDAIDRDDEKEIRRLLSIPNINIHVDDERPLEWAAGNGHLDIVKDLIARGANVHGSGHEHPLIDASESGYLDIVKYLVDHGADIYHNEDEALRQAAWNGHLNVVKYLIKKGANIHNTSDYPESALNGAAEEGHLVMVKYLLEQGADPSNTWSLDQKRNNDAIRVAAEKGHTDIVALLFQDPRVREAGLPLPDIDSNDPLAYELGKILRWNKKMRKEVQRKLQQKSHYLADPNLAAYILSYNPSYVKTKQRRK